MAALRGNFRIEVFTRYWVFSLVTTAMSALGGSPLALQASAPRVRLDQGCSTGRFGDTQICSAPDPLIPAPRMETIQ